MKKQKEIEVELEQKFGKLIIKSFAQYYGGYKPKIAGGTVSALNVGMMYLFKDHFIFKADVARKSNYWEIVIPIHSIIIDNWSPNGKFNSKNSSKDGVEIVDNMNEGKYLIIPFVDDDGVVHKPKFGIMRTLSTQKAVGASSYFGGGGIKKWMQVFYKVIVESRKNELHVKAEFSKQGDDDKNEEQCNIKQWIEEWEGLTLEFKSKDILSDNFKLGRVMVSFASNKDVEQDFGGRLVIGVNDKTRKVEGVDFDPKHEEHIINIARDLCVPPIAPIFKKIQFEGKTLYIITVPKMDTTPYRLKTKSGMVHFIRVGSTIREPDPIELAKLYNKLSAETTEDARQKQILKELLNSFKDLHEKMKMLHGIAKARELMISQNRESLERKNKQIDEMLKLIQNPLTVINEELKSEMVNALQNSRYKPAFEAMEPSLVFARKKKMIENGWPKDSPDFNINSRMVDNGTTEAIEYLGNVIKKLNSILYSIQSW